jgi:hypothetical protein
VRNEIHRMNIFLLIASTFEPLYLKCNELRRQQCRKYGVPYLILFNGKKPDTYVLQEDERHLDMEGMNPAMFLKFKNGLKEMFENGYNPDYILRTTSTLFVNFKKLDWVLSYLPKEKCCAGPWFHKNDTKIFCNGTCMIFSNDVARRLAFDENTTDPRVLNENDDVSISWLAEDYARLIDINYFYLWLEKYTSVPSLQELIPKQNVVFIRIKNISDRNEIDVNIWNMYFYLFDVMNYMN